MENYKELKNIELVIKKKLASKRIFAKELAQYLGITENGLTGMFKNQTMQVRTLVNISQFLKIPINTFFDENTINNYVNNTAHNQSYLVNESLIKYGNEEYKSLLEAKQNEIDSLKEQIQLLKEMVQFLKNK